MIIIGGLGSVLGSVFGAIFVTLLPIAIRYAMEALGGLVFSQASVLNIIPNLRLILFGALIIFFLVVEPEGLNRLWRNRSEERRVGKECSSGLWPQHCKEKAQRATIM